VTELNGLDHGLGLVAGPQQQSSSQQ